MCVGGGGGGGGLSWLTCRREGAEPEMPGGTGGQGANGSLVEVKVGLGGVGKEGVVRGHTEKEREGGT